MSDITIDIGNKIRTYRKRKNLTLEQLSGIICKSKSTVSKYEKGEIAIDIETLYEISDALNVHIEQLLYIDSSLTEITRHDSLPAFFIGLTHFYGYIYDGRNNSVLKCVFDIISRTEDGHFKMMMYMNFKDYDRYQICENTYYGFMEHYDSVTNMNFTNEFLPLEKASIQMLATSLDSETKYALWNGLSTRPLMPIAAKILISRMPLNVDQDLIEKLKISKEDIKQFKHYNMFPVV